MYYSVSHDEDFRHEHIPVGIPQNPATKRVSISWSHESPKHEKIYNSAIKYLSFKTGRVELTI